MSVDNIDKVFRQRDAIDSREGERAYFRYNQIMHRLAAYYGVTFEQAVAVFVATSPNNDYMSNLRSATSLLDGYRAGRTLDKITVSTYRAAAGRAWRVLQGEDFLSFTKGLKTRAFYRNIVDPFDPEPVTIDGHMISIWQGRRMTMVEAAIGNSTRQYRQIEEAVHDVAGRYALIPCQVQAILWFVWKRIHKPVYGDGQNALFAPDDNWGLNLQPEDIRPFEHKEVSIHAARAARKLSGAPDKQEKLWK